MSIARGSKVGATRKTSWFLFYVPTALVLAAIVAYPIGYMIAMSFNAYSLYDMAPVFNGLSNYIQAFTLGGFVESFLVTTWIIFIAIPLELVLGFLIALLFYQGLRGFNYLRALVIAPIMMMFVVTGIAWRFIYNPDYGLIKFGLSLLGLGAPHWFASAITAQFSLVIVDVWQQTPFSMMVFLAGLQSVPDSLIDSAAIDGASYPRMVRHVMIPHVRQIVLLVLLLRLIDGYKLFDYVYVLTGGGPGNSTVTMAYLTYSQAFENVQIGYGSALAMLALILSLLVGAFLMKRATQNA